MKKQLNLQLWEALALFLIVTIVSVMVAGAPAAHAQFGQSTSDITDAVGAQSATISSVAIGLSLPANTRRLDCTVTAQSLVYRYDGTDPTASVGHTVAAGGTFTIHGGNNVRRAKFIRVSSDSTLFCTASR